MEKCDFDRQFLLHSYLLNCSSNFYNNGGNQKLKAWSFQLRKNYFCMLNIEWPIARQSSITIFWDTLYWTEKIPGFIVKLRARLFRSLISVLMIKERNIRARHNDITKYLKYLTIQYNTIRCDTIRHDTIQYNTKNTIQYKYLHIKLCYYEVSS